MPKFRKRPVVIEAIQWKGDNYDEVKTLEKTASRCVRHVLNDSTLIIATLEGDHKAIVGDYIIRGIAGELYPCKPAIFDETYEAL